MSTTIVWLMATVLVLIVVDLLQQRQIDKLRRALWQGQNIAHAHRETLRDMIVKNTNRTGRIAVDVNKKIHKLQQHQLSDAEGLKGLQDTLRKLGTMISDHDAMLRDLQSKEDKS